MNEALISAATNLQEMVNSHALACRIWMQVANIFGEVSKMFRVKAYNEKVFSYQPLAGNNF